MAGQGYNLGVYDAINLGKILCDSAEVGKDLGDSEVLRLYSSMSRKYNTLLATFEQGLLLGYSDCFPVHVARNINYSIVENLPWLKQLITNTANGDHFVYKDWYWEGK